MKLVCAAIIIFLFTACNDNAGNNKTQAKTPSDSIMDVVMTAHDRGMARMEKIDATKKKLQLVMDSVSKLAYGPEKAARPYRMELDSVFNRLTFANFAMEKWMNEFNMDSFKNNEPERVKYLASEKLKIARVNDIMKNSLQKADSILKKQ